MFPQHKLEALLHIFEIASKKELKAYCGDLEIHASDFADLILAADMGAMDPYRHARFNRHLSPEHLEPTESDFEALSEATPGEPSRSVGKFATKIKQLFQDRRFLVGHLFCTSDERFWQFFYFDQRDMAEFDNHWAGGSHIHLVNDLWPNLTPRAVVEGFMADKPRMPASLHIRYNNSDD